MFGIGETELALILIFAFMIFGPDKLPGMGKTLGRALRQFRNAQEGFTQVVQTEIVDPAAEAMGDKKPNRKRSEEEDASKLSCPTCGMTYKEFVQDGRFGCADCYNTFGLLINNSIKKIQGNNSHTGKKPRFLGDKKIHADMVADAKKRQSLQEQLEICQAKQKEAVLEEDYEKAAYYRDEIKKIKERIQAGDEVV